MTTYNKKGSNAINNIGRTLNFLKENKGRAFYYTQLQKELGISRNTMLSILQFLTSYNLIFKVRSKDTYMYYYNRAVDKL